MAGDRPRGDDSLLTKPLTLDDLQASEISKEEFWHGDYNEYLAIAQKQPSVSYSAHQRLYQANISRGWKEYTFAGEPVRHYYIFDDPFENGKDAIFGLDRTLTRLVNVKKAAAGRYGQDRRIILLHGPVGSSKSTIARLERKALVAYTRTNAGKLYTYSWYVDKNDPAYTEIQYIYGTVGQQGEQYVRCPIHDDPLVLLPLDVRKEIVRRMNAVPVKRTEEELALLPRELRDSEAKPHERYAEEIIEIEGTGCPFCRMVWRQLLERYEGDWKKILANHVRVERLIFSEEDRIGIGSFHPKDEKNQDATELSGDINWSKIQRFGSESDPRAFDFRRGEYFVANRGLLYKEEILKLDKAFLYDDLHVSQDHIVKPKGFAVVHLDVVLMGGTNNPEYEKLRDDETMEAFRDRTTRIDVPYVVVVSEERKIYEKVYPPAAMLSHSAGRKHIMPHVLEIASLWAVASRLEDPKDEHLTRIQKAKVYDGRFIGEEYTEDRIKRMMAVAGEKEAMQGISPRYIQDKIANAVVSDPAGTCVTVFMVLRELEEGLATHSLIKEQSKREELIKLLGEVRKELDDILKEEVEQAVASDEGGIRELFNNYLTNLNAYKTRGPNATVKDPITGQEVPYNERLMREIEEHAGIGEREKDEFRSKIMEGIAARAMEGKKFDFKTDERLYRGLRKKLFADRKDQIKLTTLLTRVLDPEEQEKIEVVKRRLKQLFGYCDVCATVVLHHVAAIFARGEKAK